MTTLHFYAEVQLARVTCIYVYRVTQVSTEL